MGSHSTGGQPLDLRGCPRSHLRIVDVHCEKRSEQELDHDVDQGILQGHPHWDPILKVKADETRHPPTAASCWSPHVEEEGEVSVWLLFCFEEGIDAPPYSLLAEPSALARLSEDVDLIGMARAGYTHSAD